VAYIAVRKIQRLLNKVLILLMFYTTNGCHLCAQALEIMQAVNEANPDLGSIVQIELVDIAQSDMLIENYGMRIPVLEAAVVDSADNDSSRECVGALNWPFNHQDYVDLVNKAIRVAGNVS